jgi:hypothetical protein
LVIDGIDKLNFWSNITFERLVWWWTSKQKHAGEERRISVKIIVLKESMIIPWSLKNFKSIQWLISILHKKKVKSPTVGDLKWSPTVAFAIIVNLFYA